MKNGIINLRGREYKTVALRVAEFRAQFPIVDGWAIVTEPVTVTEAVVVFKASVVDPTGRLVATGYAEEERSTRGVNSTSALENCETSAVGRALAACGFAGQEYASADELANALGKQRTKTPATKTDTFVEGLHALGFTVDQVVRFCADRGWNDPRSVDVKRRLALLDWLKTDGAKEVREWSERQDD